MLLRLSLKLGISLTLFFSAGNAQAFFGMMKGMMSQMMGSGSGMMSQMCGSAMGQGMNSAYNMMSNMTPVGIMTKPMEHEALKQVLSSPEQTLRALDCARKNPQMIQMMISHLSQNRQLSYQLGDLMIHDPRVAFHVFNLALEKPPLAKFLFSYIDVRLHQQVTMALAHHKNLILPLLDLVQQDSQRIFHWTSNFMRVFTATGQVDNDLDGAEVANERFLYATFSNMKAINKFMKIMAKLDSNDQRNVMNYIFLGKNYARDYRQNKWIPVTYEKLSYYYMYAVIKGMSQLITEESESADQLKRSFTVMATKIFFNRKGKLTPFGQQMFKTMMAGAQVYKDPEVIKVSQLMMGIMGTKIKGMPQLDLSKVPPPRDFMRHL